MSESKHKQDDLRRLIANIDLVIASAPPGTAPFYILLMRDVWKPFVIDITMMLSTTGDGEQVDSIIQNVVDVVSAMMQELTYKLQVPEEEKMNAYTDICSRLMSALSATVKRTPKPIIRLDS